MMKMNDLMNEQIIKEKNVKIKRQGNRLLIGAFLLFVASYCFFFTSKVWMPPTYEDIHVTGIGSTVQANDRKVTLVSWTYDEERHIQEVIFEIDNASIDGINQYRWSAIDISRGGCIVEPVVEQGDFIVLHIKDIPARWTELSLRMDVKPDASRQTEFQMMRFYTSKQTVSQVSSITKKSETAYRMEACDIWIGLHQTQIDKLAKEIEDCEEKIRNASDRIKELEGKEAYQTEIEKADTLEMISGLESEKAKYLSEKESSLQEIAEMNQKIKLRKKMKESYQE